LGKEEEKLNWMECI